MRTCTLCRTQSPDSASACLNCGADLSLHSAAAVALARLRASPRVSRIRLTVAADACPACRAVEGTYEKESVPDLPVPGCSHGLGCRCAYSPAMAEVYP
jgi:hypothetical protein